MIMPLIMQYNNFRVISKILQTFNNFFNMVLKFNPGQNALNFPFCYQNVPYLRVEHLFYTFRLPFNSLTC